MKEMTIDEIRKHEIAILDYIDNLCKENSLKYWIDYGTLLGAVRHSGFIPWDDDIDVSMLREDYDKLIEICKNHDDNERYQFLCVEIDSKCMYPFGKMIDTNTILYESGENGIETCVYVDIFTYDNAPEDKETREKAFRKLDLYGRLRKYQLPLNKVPLSLKRICVLVVSFFIKLLIPRQYFTRRIVKNARKYSSITSDNVCILVDPYSNGHWVVKKALFCELTELLFEGKKYKAPKAYDEWLRIQYGDYMKIPPLDKQIRHNIKAFHKI